MVSAVEELEKSTLSGEKGGNVSKALENRILLPRVSTLLSPLVVQCRLLNQARLTQESTIHTMDLYGYTAAILNSIVSK